MTIDWSRIFNLTLWVFQGLLTVLFLYFGATKFDPHQQFWVNMFAQIGIGQWFRYLVGSLEIACAVLLLVPRTSAGAAALLACMMVGGIIVHLVIFHDGYAALFPAFPLFFLSVIAWSRRPRSLAHP